MNCTPHDCESLAVEKFASPESPYHYVNSGLSNVYLSGVKYRVCPTCNMQEADIPALKQLLEAVARAIVEKHSRLVGPEVRFLRKRLQKKQVEFAVLLDISSQRLSTIENSPKAEMEELREKFLRLVFPILAEDSKLKHALDDRDEFERWMASISENERGEIIVATWNKRHWSVSTTPAAA